MVFLAFFIGAISAAIGCTLGQTVLHVLGTQYVLKLLGNHEARRGDNRRSVFHMIWLSDTIGSCGMGFGTGIIAALSYWLMRSHYQGASLFVGAGLAMLLRVRVSSSTGGCVASSCLIFSLRRELRFGF